ncbi:hypothetical protein OAN21_01535 [Alphaproteobacteria bacterium]|nr:hypothetical protein [Alphaproteobacteria bacterium]
MNAGQMGFAFLARQFMQDVYPEALCTKPASVHGTDLNPGPMVAHDKFHGEVSRHGRRFNEWLAGRLNAPLEEKVSARAFLEEATPQMQRQYGLVMGIYDFMYQQTTGLLMRGDESEYKRMLVGFFLALHEHPRFDPSMYDSHDAGHVLGTHLRNVRKALRMELFFEDTFRTDPVTGLSPFDDREVFEAFIPQLMAKISQKKGSHTFEEYDFKSGSFKPSKTKAIEWIDENIHEVEVKRTPYSIGLKVSFKDGAVIHLSNPTNRKMFTLNDGHRKVLAFLGQKVKKPTLIEGSPVLTEEDAASNASAVKAYYASLRGGLIDVVDFFEARAKGMMNPGILGGPNFSEQYFEQSWDNHQEMKAVIFDLKAKQDAAETPFWKLA